MKHELPALPYPLGALAPVLSAEQLHLHHDRHHQAYVEKLNQLVRGTRFQEMTLEEIVRSAGRGPIFDSAAQHWNHSFLWKCLAPGAPPGPEGLLKLAVVRDFGSIEELLRKLNAAAAAVFGSGWAWLVSSADGRLAVETTADAETPLTRGEKPLLAIDVWEHAYYVDYRNERPRYLEALGKVLRWEFAARNFEAPLALAPPPLPPPPPPSAGNHHERRSR